MAHFEQFFVVYTIIYLDQILKTTCDQDASRLFEDLLADYNKLVRPVGNNTEALTVKFKLRLSQLLDVVSDLLLV